MNVNVYQKNDLLLRWTVQDETGATIDITGATLLFVVKTTAGKEIIRKTEQNGITVISPANGEIEIDITNLDTDIAHGVYHMELLVTDVEGNRYTAEQGTFVVLASLTAEG